MMHIIYGKVYSLLKLTSKRAVFVVVLDDRECVWRHFRSNCHDGGLSARNIVPYFPRGSLSENEHQRRQAMIARNNTNRYRVAKNGGYICIDISSCYHNLAALMLIFTFLSTLVKYMLVVLRPKTHRNYVNRVDLF